MVFIRNGLHMVALKEGSVLKIQPNPKYVENKTIYAAIMLNEQIIRIYEVENTNNTVFDVFESIISQINSGKVVTLPPSHRFKSIDDFMKFKNTMTDYSKEEMIDIYYKYLDKVIK